MPKKLTLTIDQFELINLVISVRRVLASYERVQPILELNKTLTEKQKEHLVLFAEALEQMKTAKNGLTSNPCYWGKNAYFLNEGINNE